MEDRPKFVIQVQDLVKRFGDVTAVAGVTFDVHHGEVFGILGPNGAGKTTLLELIEGLQKPDAGKTLVMGFDSHAQAQAAKARMGVQLQASSYFQFLKLREILELFGSFYDRSVAPEDLLRLVDLSEKAEAQVKQLSGGQKQRFTIAAALVNSPEVVFLDEPTTRLDPQARHNMWDLVREVHGQGRTIVLTTHYMEEAELLCDRVAIMDGGRIVALDTPRNLVREMPDAYAVTFDTSRPLDLSDLPGAEVTHAQPNEYRLRTSDALEAVEAIRRLVSQQGCKLEHLEIRPATLEDVFLSLTGRTIEQAETVS